MNLVIKKDDLNASKILAAVRGANSRVLGKILNSYPTEAHPLIKASFDESMVELAAFCQQGYQGAGTLTTDFIRELHRQLYPPGFRKVTKTPEGDEVVIMEPGKYKTLQNYSRLSEAKDTYAAPNDVEASMELLVRHLNEVLITSNNDLSDQKRRDQIVLFGLVYMLRIHPFADANGRVARIVTDLLLIGEDFPPINYVGYSDQNYKAIIEALELANETKNLVPLYTILEGQSGRR